MDLGLAWHVACLVSPAFYYPISAVSDFPPFIASETGRAFFPKKSSSTWPLQHVFLLFLSSSRFASRTGYFESTISFQKADVSEVGFPKGMTLKIISIHPDLMLELMAHTSVKFDSSYAECKTIVEVPVYRFRGIDKTLSPLYWTAHWLDKVRLSVANVPTCSGSLPVEGRHWSRSGVKRMGIVLFIIVKR